jgi:thiamine pyrophosphate-dependent acetolactate synthase large subunit-like protein
MVRNGVEHMFGVVGDGNVFMTNSFASEFGGSYVAATHEANAVSMAIGYARVTKRLGVCTVTHGPGLTNTLTPLVEAARSHTPLIVIAGEVATRDRQNLQRITQRDVATAAGAGYVRTASAETVSDDLVSAMRQALVGRMPVVFGMDADIQWSDVDVEPALIGPVDFGIAAPDPRALDEALGIIASSLRPLIVAGDGATDPASREALLVLSERIGAPLATTLKGKDLFAGTGRDIGIFGTLSDDDALDTIGRADCSIAFGASLNRWTTSAGQLLRGKRVIQCDIDPTRIGVSTEVSVGIVGGAAATASTMVEWLDAAEIEPSDAPSPRVDQPHQYPHEGPNPESPVELGALLRMLDQALGKDRVLVTDLGRAVFAAVRSVSVEHPTSFVWTAAFGSIGLGMSAAIGAAVGAPGRTVLHVTGDGGFMMGGLAEFTTAVRERLPLVVIVANDSSYGAEYVQLRDRGMDASISMSTWPDLSEVATAMGGHGLSVKRHADLFAVESAIERGDFPLLVDVILDASEVPDVSH